MRLLLLSNSTNAAGEWLRHPEAEIRRLLGASPSGPLAFVPFAGVSVSWDELTARARTRFAELGHELRSVHDAADPAALVREAAGIVVSGGNTFHLLYHLQRTALLDPIRERVRAATPYLGWSAGAVVACPTIRTTNDMPIIAPRGFEALGFVSFQINAHYTDFHPPGHRGETRAERIAEFLVLNPQVPVLGLREGAMLRVEEARITLVGDAGARLFRAGREEEELVPGAELAL